MASFDSSNVSTPDSSYKSPETVITFNEKEALMRLMAQEMIKAFIDPSDFQENDEVLTDRFEKKLQHQKAARRAKRKEKRKMSNKVKSRSTNPAIDESCSFAALTLDDIVGDSPPRRPSRGGSTASNPKEESERSGSMGDELSIDEIRQYVINNIPQAVREQIPESAWGIIFGGDVNTSSKEEKKEVGNGYLELPDEPLSREESGLAGGVLALDTDDLSTVSGLTSAFPDGKSVESQILSLSLGDFPGEDEGPPGLANISEELSKASTATNDMHLADVDVKCEKKTQRPKEVDFGTVEVRYYERIPTDNPSVVNGPAIGIGWRYKRGGKSKVEFWESQRGTPLKSWEMVLDRKEREYLLHNAGHSQKDIADCVRMCLKGKNQRQQTVNNLPVAGMEEAVEKAQRKIANLVTFGRKKALVKQRVQ
jgi:hypothetical protein